MSERTIIRAEDIRRAAFDDAANPDWIKQHPYGRGLLHDQIRAMGMLGFDVEVGIDPMSIAPCCEFTVDPNSDDENAPETAWHYLRRCLSCGVEWWALHCPHDGIQNPCGACGVVPEVVPG